ncbi:MAG: anthranilate phosphoribosyltransferase, partial [Methanothrix sp.]|nr:anthranilate phosphoribosyltransferase [Methanothrix sp.]
LSTLGRSLVAELTEDGTIREYAIRAQDLGIKEADEPSLLHESDRETEAIKLLRLLSGEDSSSKRDIICLNAAPLLCITDHASSLKEGMDRASDIIDSGKTIKRLKAWVAEQNSDAGRPLEKLEEMLAQACS